MLPLTLCFSAVLFFSSFFFFFCQNHKEIELKGVIITMLKEALVSRKVLYPLDNKHQKAYFAYDELHVELDHVAWIHTIRF